MHIIIFVHFCIDGRGVLMLALPMLLQQHMQKCSTGRVSWTSCCCCWHGSRQMGKLLCSLQKISILSFVTGIAFNPYHFWKLEDIDHWDCFSWFGLSKINSKQFFLHSWVPATFTTPLCYTYSGKECFIIFLFHMYKEMPFTNMENFWLWSSTFFSNEGAHGEPPLKYILPQNHWERSRPMDPCTHEHMLNTNSQCSFMVQ